MDWAPVSGFQLPGGVHGRFGGLSQNEKKLCWRGLNFLDFRLQISV